MSTPLIPDEETEALRARLAQYPDDSDTRAALARVYLRAQQPDRALNVLQHLPAGQGLILRSLALAGTGRLQEALRDAGQVGGQTDEPLMMHTLAYWLNQQGRWPVAAELLREALKMEPGNAGMHHDLAIALQSLGDILAALHHFEVAGQIDRLNPHLAFNTALALEQAGRLEQARDKVTEVRRLMPQHLGALYREGYLNRLMCDWTGIETYRRQLSDAFGAHVRSSGTEMVSPYGLNIHGVDPAIHDSAAAYYASQILAQAGAADRPRAGSAKKRNGNQRIRLGYLSPDFHSHAVGGLISGLFACHDRSQFDIHAYSLAERDDEIRREISDGVDHYRDLSRHGNDQAATVIERDGIDILIDLGGYTRGARPQIMAMRPARKQVSFLGYLNTMQAPFIDALVADEIVVPPGEEQDYAEQILRLPRCFLPATPRALPDATSRADHGLPASGFVFCCFNHSYKIDPECFSIWCSVLEQVPGSVLWLLGNKASVRRNLLAQLAERNLDAERLVFADRVPLADHLARMQAADLFLDTRVYNAGATAIAAAQAGLPILSLRGPRILGKMSASLNHYLGIDELICDGGAEYLSLAVELATSTMRLQTLREKMADAFARDFVIGDYCRDLERCLSRWLMQAGAGR